MDKQNPSKKPEADKINIDLNKEFLIAQMELYSAQSKELLHSAVAYSQQAIRGMFLLNGACATAIVATGDVWKYKEMLYSLAIGALLSIITSGLSYMAQTLYNSYYYKKASDAIFCYFSLNLKITKAEFVDNTDLSDTTKSSCWPGFTVALLAFLSWILSAYYFFKALNIFSSL